MFHECVIFGPMGGKLEVVDWTVGTFCSICGFVNAFYVILFFFYRAALSLIGRSSCAPQVEAGVL